MSAIKNHFHEEITKDQDDMIDDSYRYEKWKEEQAQEAQLEQEAEKAEFFKIFDLTGTYPM